MVIRERLGIDKKRPWYTSECQQLKRLLNRAEKDYKNDPFNKCKQEFLFSMCNKLKNLCTEHGRRHRNKMTAVLLIL